MGFAVAAADMAARIGLVDLMNRQVPWDPRQCKVSPGIRFLALVISCLVDPLALYRLEEFYADLDCEVLFGPGRMARDFNDDAIGRALVKLFESQVGQTYAHLCRQAVEALSLPPTDSVHFDTTTITLYGDYPGQTAGSLPTFGYNKDGHPECKQLVAGVVARHDGIPLDVDVCDGNMDDPTWSRDATLSLGHTLDLNVKDQVLFVADSKLLRHETVADLCDANIRFVSRLPNTFGLVSTTKAAAATKTTAWETLGPLSARSWATHYRIWETSGTLGEQSVRLVVVHSSALEAKAIHQETLRLERDAAQLDQALRRWEHRQFACRDDAQNAWDAWCQTSTVRRAAWCVTGEVEMTTSSESPVWVVKAAQGERATTQWDQERFRRSTFIVVSNDSRRSARELVEAYKTQFVVEQDHAVVKGPLTIAPLFLKDTRKIMAYVYVVYIALLLWQCMQAVMRQNQARLGISLPYPNKALQPAPTTKRLKEILTPIQVIHWYDATGRLQRSRSELSILERQALLLLGMDSRRFAQIPSG